MCKPYSAPLGWNSFVTLASASKSMSLLQFQVVHVCLKCPSHCIQALCVIIPYENKAAAVDLLAVCRRACHRQGGEHPIIIQGHPRLTLTIASALFNVPNSQSHCSRVYEKTSSAKMKYTRCGVRRLLGSQRWVMKRWKVNRYKGCCM